MIRYYDTQGRPLSDTLAWARLFDQRAKSEDDRWWRVGETKLGEDVKISTVWLGLDHQWYDGPPIIFESMIFGGSLDEEMVRYSTWEQAEEGHAMLVRKARTQWHCDDLHNRALARLVK